MNYYLDVLKRYFDFNGRARRKEYWMFQLINCVVAIVLGAILMVISPYLIFLVYLYYLAVLLPTLGVGARRLHDVGKSGWFQLLLCVPIVQFWIIFLLASDGQRGDNQYGPDPKADEIAAV